VTTHAKATYEWWLCGECLHVERSDLWGIEDGNNDTAVCPGCGFAHHDDESSWVDAGTEIEMQRKARDERNAR